MAAGIRTSRAYFHALKAESSRGALARLHREDGGPPWKFPGLGKFPRAGADGTYASLRQQAET